MPVRVPQEIAKPFHSAILREQRHKEFPLAGGSNKLEVRLGIRNLAAIPLFVKKRHSGHVRGRSGLPQIADIPSAMSAFCPIASALPLAPDVGGTPGECLKLNIPLEFGRGNLKNC